MPSEEIIKETINHDKDDSKNLPLKRMATTEILIANINYDLGNKK